MTFDGLINAEYDFAALGDQIKVLWEKITTDGGVMAIWDKVTSFLAQVPAMAVTGVLLVLSLIQVFAGKRLLGLQKFLLFFAVGFACGAAFLAPLIPEMIKIDAWIVGLVVGLLAAILSGLLYSLVYIIAAGYSVYLICMGGYYLPETITGFTKGNMMISLVAGAVAIVLALIFAKLIEIVGTSALGGWCAALCVIELLAQAGTALDEGTAAIVTYIVLGVLALIGTIVQFKTRKRY